MKFSMRGVALAALLACGATSAMAALSVSSAIGTGPVLFSDDSAERLIDRNANGRLDVGDSLRGIFSVGNITSGGPSVAIGAGSGYNELTAIFQTLVLSKTLVTPPGPNQRFNYTFGVDPAFAALNGAGVAAVLYDDPAQNFRRQSCLPTNTFANCEASATGGSLWAKLGPGAGGLWSAAGAVDTPGLGAFLPLSTPLGSFSIGLDFIVNNTGFAWSKVSCLDLTDFSFHLVDVCGQGGLLATGRSFGPLANRTPTPYDIFNNVDFTANRVPEPGSMSLFALALLGLGASMRKRKAK